MTETQNPLAEYVQTGSDAAFRELVARYVDLVYSSAIRLVDGDAHRAEDVAQTVFVDLAHAARTFPKNVMLGGWLHRHTCFVAMKTMRSERRRESRERQAVETNALQDNSRADFSHVAPILDEAINELGEADRTAILLRFFEQHDFRAVGQAIGANEDAARMRVTRALEKLQGLLKSRGVSISAGTLCTALSANAVQTVPAGLALAFSSTALAATTFSASITATTTQAVVMTTLQKTLITAAVVVVTGAGIFEMRRSADLQKQIETLQQQHAPHSEEIRQWQREREDFARQLAALREENERLNRNSSELLKLRGEIGLLRDENSRLTKSRAGNLENQNLHVASRDIKFTNLYLGKDEWQNRGAEFPVQTLETMLWAIKQGDKSMLEQLVVRTNESQPLDRLILPMSYWDEVNGVQIVDVNIVSDGSPRKRAMIGTIVKKQAIESATGETFNPTTIRRWFFIETNGQWRVTGGG